MKNLLIIIILSVTFITNVFSQKIKHTTKEFRDTTITKLDLDCENCLFENVFFDSVHISEINLDGSLFIKCTFDNCIISGDFSQTVFWECVMTNNIIKNADLTWSRYTFSVYQNNRNHTIDNFKEKWYWNFNLPLEIQLLSNGKFWPIPVNYKQ